MYEVFTRNKGFAGLEGVSLATAKSYKPRTIMPQDPLSLIAGEIL